MNKKNIKKSPQGLKLNLGSGVPRIEGFLNVDYAGEYKPDLVANLESYPWPIKDNSVSEIKCFHVVEHISDIRSFMIELFRISKDGCVIELRYPLFTSKGAYADPTHRHYLSHNSLEYFSNKHINNVGKIFPSHVNFELIDKNVKVMKYFNVKNFRLLSFLESLRVPMQECKVTFKVHRN